MNLKPVKNLSEDQLKSGLKLVVADGLSAEAMVVFTSGTFLTAMAIQMGASNFQLGVLAALPTFTTIFQLLSIWLVQKFKNRRAITAFCNFMARVPLIAIGVLPFLFTAGTSIEILIVMLFFQHIFGDLAGASWNAWMKDLIPGSKLGSFFSHRSRMAQTLNVSLSLATALGLDYIKSHYPASEIMVYHLLFLAGGMLGMVSVVLLLRTPEPEASKIDGNLFALFSRPLKNRNFRNLLIFNSCWAFALNLATPFFAVFMMKTMGLPVAYIIGLGIISQLSSIVSIKIWGRYSDRFSNKNIVAFCAPLYIACILAFAFAATPGNIHTMLALLVVIHVISGLSTAGINLSLSNIGIKLAPNNEAIAYITAKNMFVALFSTLAPVVGGLMADFFVSHRIEWNLHLGFIGMHHLHLLTLQGWNYFFIIGGVLALISLRLLKQVNEKGEIRNRRMVIHMQSRFRSKLRDRLGYNVTAKLYYPQAVMHRRKIMRLKQRQEYRNPV
ncbi:MAG: MFS transporter [Bacteroidetes bacterium]|nr:MFS transporter [Bacteroidota bacterium]